eukprot:17347-Heterococcus_DN1.PRE.8
MSAPAAMSTLIASRWPATAALPSGVTCRLLRAFTSAPLCSSRCTLWTSSSTQPHGAVERMSFCKRKALAQSMRWAIWYEPYDVSL